VGFGESEGSGITGALCGLYHPAFGYDFFQEYTHDNKQKYKDPEQIAKDIIGYCMSFRRKYYEKTHDYSFKRIVIEVDNSEKAFISIINMFIRQNKLTQFLYAQSCGKQEKGYKINDRINYVLACINNGKMRIDFSLCPILYKEMASSKRKRNITLNTETIDREKKNDHLINTLEYAICRGVRIIYNQITKDTNNVEDLYTFGQ
jgi:hypothetical protein